MVCMSSIKNSQWFKVKYDKCGGEGAIGDLENLRRVRLVSAHAVRKGVMDQRTFKPGHFLWWLG